MHLSGQLSDWSISDLLHIMEVTDKTGSLDIKGDRHGRIHFRDGKVTGAELTAANGAYVGSDASGVADVLYVLSTLDDGSFAVGAADGPDGPGWKVEDVIAEVEALRGIEAEVAETGLFDAESIALTGEIEEPVTIGPEDWQILMNLVSPFTFDRLESEKGRVTAVRLLHTLHRLGIADTTQVEEDDSQSDWLGQLADDVIDPDDLIRESNGQVSHDLSDQPEREVEDTTDGEPDDSVVEEHVAADVKGVSAPASTTLTDGVYDEIRRLRSRVGDK